MRNNDTTGDGQNQTVSPLPVFWPWGQKYRGWRIENLPAYYRAEVLTWPNLPRDLRGAVMAVSGLNVLAQDEREGR